MIVYASLVRTQDALPLCATNDFSKVAEHQVKEGKRIVKLVSKECQKLLNKLCVQGDDLTVHCIKDDCTSYVVVCNPSYPHILAYSFLDELLKEFSLLYTPSVINSVKRPYAFIEFDSYLQKVQMKYNSPRCLTTRLNLPDLTSDLNLNPPTYIKLSDLEPVRLKNENNVYSAISISNGSVSKGIVTTVNDSSKAGIKLQLKPVPWYGRIAMIIALPCICLDGYRGIVSLESFSAEDNDGPTLVHGMSFIFEMLVLCAQVYCLRKYWRYRKLAALFSFILLLLLNLPLADIREVIIIVIYVTMSFCLFFATVRRTFEKCLPRLNV